MGKIKCTYEDCFRHFDDQQSMIRHKVKDPAHSYCKICDVDCADDMYFFIHQLASPNHICCPICALEFKSTSARDTHVSSQHRASSNIECAGCQEQFNSGNALMRHIEQDECQVISIQDFQMQRAERQIQKQAWETDVEPFGVAPSARHHRSITKTKAIQDLLDADPTNIQGHSQADLSHGPDSVTSQAQYPPLVQPHVNPAAQANRPPNVNTKPSSNLIDLNGTERALSNLNINQPTWAFDRPSAQQPPPQYANDPRIKNWVTSVRTAAATPPADNASEVASMYDKPAVAVSDLSTSVPPPSTQALPNTNAPRQHVIRMPAHTVVSTNAPLDIEKYWDPIRQVYGCPTTKCRRQFRTAEQFRTHLLSSAHIGGQVTCPSCLKKFATTAAWVAHTESASKKCNIRTSFDYNHVMREITGGVLGTRGFNEDGSIKFVAPKIDQWNEDGW
ncbi:hypothetical protein A1O7_08426 [Cladophialophora yegresii CBS 114405]|uniref:C2H2-type domain-containing protein n=1 Tax=Cladophialophora yegresii CBS 114405 TaxID=1182544 RepID=W9WAA7_9EURO|nr:uncharacterized protein A1O7_08426 [Cladophialophora yegresii CBS 114405]EXJ55499.1 hypothetical protein A1O7_08426 [Cladophialophora yegresii CBS 114405]